MDKSPEGWMGGQIATVESFAKLQAQLKQLRLDFEDLRADFSRMKDGLTPRPVEDSPLQRAFEQRPAHYPMAYDPREHGIRPPGSGSPMFCGHANENPRVCDCPEWCYCQTRTCKNRVAIEHARERDERDRG